MVTLGQLLNPLQSYFFTVARQIYGFRGIKQEPRPNVSTCLKTDAHLLCAMTFSSILAVSIAYYGFTVASQRRMEYIFIKEFEKIPDLDEQDSSSNEEDDSEEETELIQK
jgi:hypothetical protein